ARSYLHVNCAHCHQFNAGGAANIALSHHVPLASTGTLGTRPTQGTFGITGARIISPGDPLGSVLYYRISKLGGGRMPRLGSAHVDLAGASMIHDWIAHLTPQETVAPHPITPGLAASLASNSDNDRTAAITALTTSTRGALALLRWVTDHPDPRLQAQVLAVTRNHPATEVRDLFERFLPPDQRVKRLGTVVDRGAILGLPANPEQGRNVFFNNPAAACKNCHRIGKQGETRGPDLNQIGKKYNAAQLLEQILEPSKLMEPKYVPYLMETAEGQILTGLLEKQTDEEVWIKDARNRIHKVPAEDIELLVRQRKSLMPELLLRDLTAQQVANLVAFLATLK
ncbi:MAG: c-type cytochrome, partial [Planctomycetota bacterium]|nr:c-type cytochrome [Planctomycetota bacterium]